MDVDHFVVNYNLYNLVHVLRKYDTDPFLFPFPFRFQFPFPFTFTFPPRQNQPEVNCECGQQEVKAGIYLEHEADSILALSLILSSSLALTS